MMIEQHHNQNQKSWTIFLQIIIPFFLSGLGCGAAGIVLNHVAKWPVFDAIPQISIMVPAFIGMIGNIETTFASRLSTQANVGGHMNSWKNVVNVVAGNIMVVECQASIMAMFAALMSLTLSTIRKFTRDKITLETALILCAGSVISSILANTVIASIVTIVVIVGHRFNINPDNISAPIAACMGDASTVTILAYINSSLYNLPSNNYKIVISLVILIVTLFVITPVMILIARRNTITRSVIYSGWIPLLAAIVLCKPAGLIMEISMERWPKIATFFPLIDGVGAQVVGLQTSRISTFLHATQPKRNNKWFYTPKHVFLSEKIHSKLARMLVIMSVPSHLIFLTIIYLLQQSLNETSFNFTGLFVLTHSLAVLLQIIILLYMAYLAVYWTWNHGIDPDNSVMPLATTLSDSLGICFVTVGFHLLNVFNDINTIN